MHSLAIENKQLASYGDIQMCGTFFWEVAAGRNAWLLKGLTL